MNILTDDLPTEIMVNGGRIPIASDWKICLKVIMAFEDVDLASVEKQQVLLHNLFYDEGLPADLPAMQELYNQAIWFLNCGRADTTTDSDQSVFSFEHDAQYIFSAFRQTHGIDLVTARMHWWAFFSLFMDLGSETTFVLLAGLRKRYQKGKATKEEQEMIREMGGVFDLPDDKSFTADEAAAIDRFDQIVAEHEARKRALRNEQKETGT